MPTGPAHTCSSLDLGDHTLQKSPTETTSMRITGIIRDVLDGQTSTKTC